MKTKLLLWAACAAFSTGSITWLSHISWYSSSHAKFLIFFFLLWECIAIFLVPMKFSSLKTSGQWGVSVCAAFSLLMAASVVLFPIYLSFLPFWALGIALFVELLLAFTSLSIVYGSLKFLERQDSLDDE